MVLLIFFVPQQIKPRPQKRKIAKKDFHKLLARTEEDLKIRRWETSKGDVLLVRSKGLENCTDPKLLFQPNHAIRYFKNGKNSAKPILRSCHSQQIGTYCYMLQGLTLMEFFLKHKHNIQRRKYLETKNENRR